MQSSVIMIMEFLLLPPLLARSAPAANEFIQTVPLTRGESDSYNRYSMNQLHELLTDYGPIHEAWFRSVSRPLQRASWPRPMSLAWAGSAAASAPLAEPISPPAPPTGSK